jgi:hypothetical protein
METIDLESRLRSRVPLDVDNMSLRYATTNGLFTFTSPSFWTLEKNLFYLLRNSTQVEFDIKYTYKPDYFSYDEYGTVSLSYLLMYVNSVYCIEDFDLVTIVIPTMDAIIEVCKDKFSVQDLSDLTRIDW